MRLAAAGARVALVARTIEQLDRTVAEIQRAGGEAVAMPGDVTDPGGVGEIVAAVSRSGPICMLVNNAGVPGTYGPIDQIDPLEWWTAQEVNVFAPVLFMNAVIPGMRARRSGRIVNIVSNAALQPIPCLSAYAVSKNTLVRLTETVDLEIRESGLHAFALHPGNITTDMARGTVASPAAQRWLAQGLPNIRDRKAEDSDADLKRCAAVVAAIAAGFCDDSSGRYLDLWKDVPADLEVG